MPTVNEIPTPRITFEVDPDVKRRLDMVIPWGFLTPVYQAITEDLLELLDDEENVKAVLGAIALRKLKLQDFLRLEVGNNG